MNGQNKEGEGGGKEGTGGRNGEIVEEKGGEQLENEVTLVKESRIIQMKGADNSGDERGIDHANKGNEGTGGYIRIWI